MNELLLTSLALLFLNVAPLALVQDATLSGRITDMHGCPLAGAIITVRDETGAVIGRSTARPNGNYVIERLPHGQLRIRFELEGFNSGEYVRPVVPGANTFDSALALGRLAPVEPHRVSGIVTDEMGRGLPEATVSILNLLNNTLVMQTRTNQNGRYTLEVRDFGQYILTAANMNSDAAVQLIRFRYDDGAGATANFRLRAGPNCKRPN